MFFINLMGFKLVKWIDMDCLYVLMGKNDAEMEHDEFPCYKWMNMSMKRWFHWIAIYGEESLDK